VTDNLIPFLAKTPEIFTHDVEGNLIWVRCHISTNQPPVRGKKIIFGCACENTSGALVAQPPLGAGGWRCASEDEADEKIELQKQSVEDGAVHDGTEIYPLWIKSG
jgi:hypothetical protein